MPIETKEIPANEFRGDVLKKKYTVHYEPSTGVYSFDYVEIPEAVLQELAKLSVKRVTGKDPGEVKAQLDTILEKEATPPPRIPEKGEITKASEEALAEGAKSLNIFTNIMRKNEESLSEEEKQAKEKAKLEITVDLIDKTAKEAIEEEEEVKQKLVSEGLSEDEINTLLTAAKDYLASKPLSEELRRKLGDHSLDITTLYRLQRKLESYKTYIEPLDKGKRKETLERLYKPIQDNAVSTGVTLRDLDDKLRKVPIPALTEEEQSIKEEIDAYSEEDRNLFWSFARLFEKPVKELPIFNLGENTKSKLDKQLYEDAIALIAQMESISVEKRSAEQQKTYADAKSYKESYERTTPLSEEEAARKEEQEYLIAKAMKAKLEEKQALPAGLSVDEQEKLTQYTERVIEYETDHPGVEGNISTAPNLGSVANILGNEDTKKTYEERRYRSAIRNLKTIAAKNQKLLTEAEQADKKTKEEIRNQFVKNWTEPRAFEIATEEGYSFPPKNASSAKAAGGGKRKTKKNKATKKHTSRKHTK